MMLKDAVIKVLSQALHAGSLSGATTHLLLEHPGVVEHGDFSTNIAMKLAKEVGKNPRDLAKEIISYIPTSPIISKCEVAGGGFINIYLSEKALRDELEFILKSKREYGRPDVLDNKKVSVEHTQVNPNKEPHVGHLRNAVIGDSLVQMLRFLGNKVVTLYYQNDLGQQVASILLAHKKQWVKREDFPTLITWASKAYADIERRMELGSPSTPSNLRSGSISPEAEKLRGEKEELQIRIADQSTREAKEAREITDEILKETLLTLQKLRISYDCIVRESDIVRAKLWEQTFELLKKNRAFYLSDEGEKKGCWMVKVPGAEDKIIVRSNGVPTYAGNDIANHLWKFGRLPDFKYEKLDWNTQEESLYTTSVTGETRNDFSHAEEIVNIIDTTQTYEQQSVIESLRALGYEEEASNYHHVNYGFAYLSPKTAKQLGFEVEEDARQVKMSGRKGTVVSVETFLKKIEETLKGKFGEFETLTAVRNGAIKFELLKYDTYQDIVFDLDAALDVNGYSGPYVQYAYTRAVNVLRKANSNPSTDSGLHSPGNQQLKNKELTLEEKGVMRMLYQFPEVVSRATRELSPHYLCTYLFELSRSFNAFYNAQRIIDSENETERLKLTEAVAITLKNGLRLLNIEAPERM